MPTHHPMSGPSPTLHIPSATIYTSFAYCLTSSEPIQTSFWSLFCCPKIDVGPRRHLAQPPGPSESRARNSFAGVFACYLDHIKQSARFIHPYSARFTLADPLQTPHICHVLTYHSFARVRNTFVDASSYCAPSVQVSAGFIHPYSARLPKTAPTQTPFCTTTHGCHAHLLRPHPITDIPSHYVT